MAYASPLRALCVSFFGKFAVIIEIFRIFIVSFDYKL